MEDPKQADPTRRKVPAVLWPRQRELVEFLVRGLEEQKPRVVIKGRELGVSWTSTFLIYNWLREDVGFKAKLGSRKEDLVDGDDDSLFAKIRFNHALQPDFLRPPLRSKNMSLRNEATKGEVVGEATNAGFARGGRRRVMLLDEFAHVDPQPLQQRIWTSIQSVAASIWAVSSPAGPGNKFAQLVESLPSDCVMVMPWQTDPRRDEEWRQAQLQAMTEEEFAQEHEGKVVTLFSGRVFTARKPVVEYWGEDGEFHGENTGHLAARKPVDRFPLVGGWDFGSGDSLLVCQFAMVDMTGTPTIWIDRELAWQQSSWRTAGADAKSVMRMYRSGKHIHFGDPAGRQVDSSQHSWESNLQAAGIPIMCFDDMANSRDGMEWAVKQTNALLADGRLRIHRRCTYLWACLENWRREVPAGMELNYVSRAYIPPRHDYYSHGGRALTYLVSGILKTVATIRALAGVKADENLSGEELMKRASEASGARRRDPSAIYEPQQSVSPRSLLASLPAGPGIPGVPSGLFGAMGSHPGGWDGFDD